MNTENKIISIDSLAELQWACRRGMLELDVILGNFLKQGYTHLSSDDKQHFIRLLNYPDPVLFDYFLGRVEPEDANLAKITEIIRQHARSGI